MYVGPLLLDCKTTRAAAASTVTDVNILQDDNEKCERILQAESAAAEEEGY